MIRPMVMVRRRFLVHGRRAFTLLELATVVLVVAILAVMMLPVLQHVQARAARSKCIDNMRGLHVAADLYVQEHHSWPQIKNDGVSRTTIATAWIARLQPYGLDQINWICPTMQTLLGNPDLSNSNNVRIDYTATVFDSNPQTPFRWAKQPWFVENGNMHGNGNLIVFPDGHVQEMNEFIAAQGSGGSASH
jgi:prepilin-type N-terminal cleavage/methylation domain-containing protein